MNLEHPQEGEVIISPGYTFQVDGPADAVDIAIDGGDWRACRRSGDSWSYHWSGYGPGRHQALIRGEEADGASTVKTCRFVVAPAR